MTVYQKEPNYRNVGPVAKNRAFFSLKSENTSGSLRCEIITPLKTAGDSAAILHSLERSYKDFLSPLVGLRIQFLQKIQEKVNVCVLASTGNMPYIL